MNKFPLYFSSISQKISCTLLLTIFFSLATMPINAQNNPPLLGHWQLQKVSFKKKIAHATEHDKDLLLNIFKAALYENLTTAQKFELEDLEWTNAQAEILLDTYHQTTIEFQSNGAFYNTSLNKEKSLSGEYLLDKKKLYMQWETTEKTNFKISKNTADELVLKDTDLKIIYYYAKPDKKKSMNFQQD